MDEAVGAVTQQVGQLSQLGVAGLCLAALLWTYVRALPAERMAHAEQVAALNRRLANRGREVRGLMMRIQWDDATRAGFLEDLAKLEASGRNGEAS